jgi:hypothetical protein
VLDYLESLAGSAQRDQEWAQFEQSCLTSGVKRNGWKFNRDEPTIEDMEIMPTPHEQQPTHQHRYSTETYCAWLDEAEKGLADVAAGRSSDARASILAIQARRSASRIWNAPCNESTNL